MAEKTNAEKLAAGRRKLKEFQQKCKERSPVQNKKCREVDGKDELEERSTAISSSCLDDKVTSSDHFHGKQNFGASDPVIGLNGNKDILILIENKPDHIIKGEFQPILDNENNESGSSEGLNRNDSHPPSSSPEKSSTEALRQLSMQMDGLVADSLLLDADTGTTQLPRSHRAEMDVELLNRNQELAGLLEEEKRQADSLKVQIKECKSRISQLESEKESWVSEGNVKLDREMRPLREQLQLHVQTVGVLVGEKTELSAALSRSQVVARQKTELVEELQTKLRDSQVRLTELARELSTANEERGMLKQQVQKHEDEARKCAAKLSEISLQLEEKDQEVSEVRQKLNVRSNEAVSLQKELEDVKSKLLLSRLRLRQLTGSSEGAEDEYLESSGKDEADESWHHHRVHLERQNEDLKKAAQDAIEEREEASRRFQTYIHTLNGQMEVLAKKVEALTSENKILCEREQSLVSHLSELEKQLQKCTNKSNSKEEEDANHRLSLEKKCITLQEQLDDKISELEVLENKLKSMDCKVQQPQEDVEKGNSNIQKETAEEDEPRQEGLQMQMLLAAMESDKVAASRAVDQNLKLKAQLAELQDAFVKLSNDKLVLTEKLNNSEYLSKDQAEKLSKLEQQLHQLRTKQDTETDQKCIIEELKIKVNSMEQDQSCLAKGLGEQEEKQKCVEITSVHLDHSKEQDLHLSSQESEDLNKGSSQSLTETEAVQKLEGNPNKGGGQSLTESEAVQKLQERFRCTMEELATLTEEKQRLEHLVLQLQGETETIGEYVALYQTQRGLLRQRAREKDEQLVKISKDREELRSKLTKLESLVRKLVNEDELKDNSSEVTEVAMEVKEKVVEPSLSEILSPDANILKGKTAAQIMELLTEIGSNSSLTETSIPSTFHPCPWCSGQLLTV
ncbi:golgin subfamily A member 2 [Hetaerina americana]|uniref:golgin subfamily A member 2 n=1 Tax=Hetaerina americana TaxID=62018 RepID=UPI003A7F62C7